MSFTDTRVALAQALSTIPGITGYRHRPGTLKKGAAWPLLSTVDRGPGDNWAGTWRVIIFLGGDEKDAQDFLDAKLPTVHEVLDPVAFVDRAFPITLNLSGNDAYAVAVDVRSE